MQTFDLLIIGGGILGSAATFFATRAGLKTALLEQRASLAAHTTAKAVSCFRKQWDEPDFFYLMKHSIAVYENFGAVIGLGAYDIGMHQQGWLFASATQEGATRLQNWWYGQRALGVDDSEYLDGADARKRFPFLSEQVTGATFRARDGWLSPNEAASGFVRAAELSGSGKLFLDTRVTRIVLDGERAVGVETTRGNFSAPCVAVCAGPHSAQFGAQCGVDLPITLARRQRAFVATRAAPSDAPMVADDDTGAYWRPESGGAFLGWAQDEPAQPPLDDVAPDADFAAVALDACARLTPFWNEVAPHLRKSDVSVAAGQYSMTPDSKPLIGESSVRGLYFLTGDNGFGIESAPQAARHLIQIMTGELTEQENLFRLDRPMRTRKKLVL
jgi:sarcosine oxidase subunit beta